MAAAEPLILTLQIDKVQSGVYLAEVLCRGVQVADPTHYERIGDAIRAEALAVPDGYAHFMEVRYCELSSGTIPLGLIGAQADAIAKRLVDLMSEMRLIAEG
ncbi:hypothetical protein [Hydrogenophaga sp. PML113]|uniref:hypothetical protein n=1 Tax=Hydrogenophaga sp. PML113 TaxID=1899350 RepID=UPI000878223B|nr:hypothetical protein [Hydrogenophaga sp. PML113]